MTSWKESSLGEVCELYQPKTLASAELVDYGDYLVYGANGVIGRHNEYNHENAEVLVTCRGATCGTVNVSEPKSWINGNAMVVKPRSGELDFCFLKHLLRGGVDLSVAITGAAQPQITRQSLAPIRFTYPELPEQRRIAAILDKADALRAKRREALVQLDRLAQAIFVEIFGDPLKNSRGWPSDKSLGDVADIVSGVTKGRKLEGKQTREVPYLAVANVQDMRLNLESIKFISATEDEISRYRLKEGDLLLTEGGDPDKLGRGTLWHGELPECIHQNHVFRVRLTSDELTPYYLNWLVGSQRGKRYFLKSAKQTTGIASINMTQLRGFPLLLPPISLQKEFEKAIGALRQHQKLQVQANHDVDVLFASLQHRAFRGEL